MKIFITGGSGFIGRNLVEFFKDSHQIYYPPSQKLDLTNEGDVKKYIKQHKFDVIIHSANHDGVTKYTTKSREDILYKNLRMFFNIVKNKSFFGKLINIGSGAEYSREHYIDNMTEEYFDSFIPTDQYGFSKYIMSKYCELNKNFINVRLFGVYGKYEDWRVKFISNSCCKNIYNLPIHIEKDRYMDFLHIDDICKSIKQLLNKNNLFSIYNICSSSPIKLLEIAFFITKTFNKTNIFIHQNEDNIKYYGNNTKFIEEFGKDLMYMNIEDGIKKTYEYYNRNKGVFNKKFLIQQNIEMQNIWGK